MFYTNSFPNTKHHPSKSCCRVSKSSFQWYCLIQPSSKTVVKMRHCWESTSVAHYWWYLGWCYLHIYWGCSKKRGVNQKGLQRRHKGFRNLNWCTWIRDDGIAYCCWFTQMNSYWQVWNLILNYLNEKSSCLNHLTKMTQSAKERIIFSVSYHM